MDSLFHTAASFATRCSCLMMCAICLGFLCNYDISQLIEMLDISILSCAYFYVGGNSFPFRLFPGLGTISGSAVTKLLMPSVLTMFRYCSLSLFHRAENLLFQSSWGKLPVETIKSFQCLPCLDFEPFLIYSALTLSKGKTSGPQYRLKLYQKFLTYNFFQ